MLTKDLSNLKVTMIPPATNLRPLEGRKYTLTKCPETEKLLLSIGHHFDYNRIQANHRDEILAAWSNKLGHFVLIATVFVADEKMDKKLAQDRFLKFINDMEHGIKAIVTGDQNIYTEFPWVLDAPIYVNFNSTYPEFHKTISYGTPRHYLRNEKKKVAEFVANR